MKVSQKVNFFLRKKKSGPSSDFFWQKCAYVDRAKKVIFCEKFETAPFTIHQKSWKSQKNTKTGSIVKGIKRVFPKTYENFTSSYYAYFMNKNQNNSVCSGHKIVFYFYRFVMSIKLSFILVKLLFFATFDHLFKVIRWWNHWNLTLLQVLMLRSKHKNTSKSDDEGPDFFLRAVDPRKKVVDLLTYFHISNVGEI